MGGVASTIAALGNGSADGDIGFIRVDQGGESEMVKLYWDATALKWISNPLPIAINSDDSDWTRSINGTATDWAYWGSNGSNLGQWTLTAGAIPFAGALFTAGLQLQDRIQARMLDGGSPVYIAPWFYEYNDGDPVVFSNDVGAQGAKTWNGHADLGFAPSAENIGHGAVLSSDSSTTSRLYATGRYEDNLTTSGYHNLARNAGWDYVKFFSASQPNGPALGGVPTTTPYTPSKKYLYPTLYGYGMSQGGGGGVAAFSWECRWTS